MSFVSEEMTYHFYQIFVLVMAIAKKNPHFLSVFLTEGCTAIFAYKLITFFTEKSEFGTAMRTIHDKKVN